ncbi:MAG: HAD family phosphatase [Firmicutes bacterium]|nr:HAD family phosphatase [Bacillota bacterium]
MAIKMIGLDLDGTTLSSERDFSKRTIETIGRAIEKGVEVIIATGRAEHSLPKAIYEIPGLNYVATSNGARVIDLKEKKTVYKNFIDPNRIPEIHKVLKENDADIEVFFDGTAYIGAREYDSIISGENTTRNKEYIIASRSPSHRIFDLLIENKEKIENININYRELSQKEPMEKILKSIQGVHLTSSVPLNNEIGGKTTSKADALRFLMERAGLKRENLMACGDNPNDLEMIVFAGIGVAMGNAEDVVKEAADFVTLPNYEDGVAYAIEKFVL